jgi:alkanesulfonate monooxygenase SsuD/methylene tetrahydromethanopterin reductase-like flavin-dependent oxidoreductase (luciferase family)
MDFGVLALARAGAESAAHFAEQRGFTHWWAGEGQMLFSDPYAYLALCAATTKKIKLCTGVTNPLTRMAPVTANAVATINALAPGRVILGIGSGNNAMRAMGMRPARLDEMRDMVRVCRALLAGEQVEYTFDGRKRLVAMLDPQGGWYSIAEPIPIYMAAGAPKMLELAGEIADGVIVTAVSAPLLQLARRYIERGAARAGRKPSDVKLVALVFFYLRRPADTLEDIIRYGVGSGPISGALTMLETACRHPEVIGGELSDDLQRLPRAYRPPGDLRDRHLEAWRKYMKGLDMSHAALITPGVLEGFGLVGSAEECLDKVRRMRELGVDQVMILPSAPENVVRDIEDFSRAVISRL